MAGPRAPIGTLSQHAAAASNLVRKMVPGRFRGEQGRDRKPEPVKDESDSDSDSTSETSSETDTSTGSEADNSTSKNWAEGLRNKAKPNGVKFEPKKGNSVKESESKSDSESERDSESQSENTKANPKDKIDVDEESESSSESESDDEMADAPPMKAPPSPNTIRRSMAAHTSESSSSESSDDEIVESDESEDEKQAEAEAESESESEEEVPPKQQTQPVKLAPKEAPKSKPFTNGTKSKEFVSVSESSSESDEEEEPTKTVAKDNRCVFIILHMPSHANSSARLAISSPRVFTFARLRKTSMPLPWPQLSKRLKPRASKFGTLLRLSRSPLKLSRRQPSPWTRLLPVCPFSLTTALSIRALSRRPLTTRSRSSCPENWATSTRRLATRSTRSCTSPASPALARLTSRSRLLLSSLLPRRRPARSLRASKRVIGPSVSPAGPWAASAWMTLPSRAM